MQQPASGKPLVAVLGGSLAAVGGLAALLLYWEGRPLWWEGYKAAMVIGGMTAVGSLVPLWVGLRRGLKVLAAVYFASFLLRTLVWLAAVVVAIRVMEYPLWPTIVLGAVFYLTLLGAETAYLGVAYWSAKA